MTESVIIFRVHLMWSVCCLSLAEQSITIELVTLISVRTKCYVLTESNVTQQTTFIRAKRETKIILFCSNRHFAFFFFFLHIWNWHCFHFVALHTQGNVIYRAITKFFARLPKSIFAAHFFDCECNVRRYVYCIRLSHRGSQPWLEHRYDERKTECNDKSWFLWEWKRERETPVDRRTVRREKCWKTLKGLKC